MVHTSQSPLRIALSLSILFTRRDRASRHHFR